MIKNNLNKFIVLFSFFLAWIFFAAIFTPSAYSSCTYTIQGDTDVNGSVDASDLFPIAQYYGVTSSGANYNCVVDANGDGIIDASDLFPVAQNYGMAATGNRISGIVSAPTNVSLGRSTGKVANAGLGLSAVVSTTVETYLVDGNGNKIGNTIARTNTDISGTYNLILPTSIAMSTNLVVSVGSGANQMRSIVTNATTSVNINPITESVTKKIIESPQPISNFSVAEVLNIQTQVENAVITANINFSNVTTISDAIAVVATNITISTFINTIVTDAGNSDDSLSKITGTVIDKSTQFPISDAVVKIYSNGYANMVITSTDGKYTFYNLTSGIYYIIATKNNYTLETKTVTIP